jgi:hypothetical protein
MTAAPTNQDDRLRAALFNLRSALDLVLAELDGGHQHSPLGMATERPWISTTEAARRAKARQKRFALGQNLRDWPERSAASIGSIPSC